MRYSALSFVLAISDEGDPPPELVGDWTDEGLPGTIETTTVSGQLVAGAVVEVLSLIGNYHALRYCALPRERAEGT